MANMMLGMSKKFQSVLIPDVPEFKTMCINQPVSDYDLKGATILARFERFEKSRSLYNQHDSGCFDEAFNKLMQGLNSYP